MTIVVDNSVALAWTLKDERSDQADALLERVLEGGGHVPSIFRAEFANGLTMASRRGRIDPQDRSGALAFIETLQLTHNAIDPQDIAAAMRLADTYRLTVYDALYLELAQRKRLPLATFDKRLTDAARQAGAMYSLAR